MLRRVQTLARPLFHIRNMSAAHTSAAAAVGAEDVVTFPTSSNPHVAMYHLNRPRALNSLNQPMVDLLREKVDRWIDEKETRVVVGRGEGRGFCAGGDVKRELKLELSTPGHLKDFILHRTTAYLTLPFNRGHSRCSRIIRRPRSGSRLLPVRKRT
jgi:hypothetical protein